MRPKEKTGNLSKITATFFAVVLFFPVLVFAEAKVQTHIDRDALDPEDTLTLTIAITSDEELDSDWPDAGPLQNDFTVINRWNSSAANAQMVRTNSGMKFQTMRSAEYNYILQPRREGDLKIPSLKVTVNGTVIQSESKDIKVAKGASPRSVPQGRPKSQPGLPQGMPNPFGDDEEDDLFSQLLRRQGIRPPGGTATEPINPQEAFFVQVEVDKTDVYVGEQVTASWYLLTRGQIRDLDTLKYPSLKGFWKEDIEIATHLNFTTEVIKGVTYKKALLASFALFPIKEGSVTIDPYTAKCSVLAGNDVFGSFGVGKAYTFTKSSQPVKVNVRPLPIDGRPADFTGAVGQFQVSGRVEDTAITTGQPFSFKVRFEGKGNAKLIEVPAFQPPEGLELYDTQKEAKFFRTGTSFRDFSFLLIPRQAGDFTIPSLSLSIFDPVTGKYVARATDPIRIHVVPGQGIGQLGARPLENGEKMPEVAFEPQPVSEWQASRAPGITQTLLMFSAGLLLISVVLIFKARHELGWGQRKKDLTRRLRARLKRLDQLVGKKDWRNVGVETTNTLYFVLGEISGEGGANIELDKLLLKAPPSVRREVGEQIKKLMAQAEVLSFAPEEIVGDLKDQAKLKDLSVRLGQVMEKAVALGLSVEQSDASGLNPTTS